LRGALSTTPNTNNNANKLSSTTHEFYLSRMDGYLYQQFSTSELLICATLLPAAFNFEFLCSAMHVGHTWKYVLETGNNSLIAGGVYHFCKKVNSYRNSERNSVFNL
jgi:hypothetical protein